MNVELDASLPDILRWPIDLLIEAVRTASWVTAGPLRRDADHFLADIGMKVALRGPLEERFLTAGSAVVDLAHVLDEVSPGCPDDENAAGARSSAVEALVALQAELVGARPSERAKHLRISW